MKYMGSKQQLLAKGLGDILVGEITGATRFIDLFSGGGSVVTFVASNLPVETVAVDLQCYAKVLAEAVISRTTPVNADRTCKLWFDLAFDAVRSDVSAVEAARFEVSADKETDTESYANPVRSLSSKNPDPFVRAYGGYYYGLSHHRTIIGREGLLS